MLRRRPDVDYLIGSSLTESAHDRPEVTGRQEIVNNAYTALA